MYALIVGCRQIDFVSKKTQENCSAIFLDCVVKDKSYLGGFNVIEFYVDKSSEVFKNCFSSDKLEQLPGSIANIEYSQFNNRYSLKDYEFIQKFEEFDSLQSAVYNR